MTTWDRHSICILVLKMRKLKLRDIKWHAILIPRQDLSENLTLKFKILISILYRFYCRTNWLSQRYKPSVLSPFNNLSSFREFSYPSSTQLFLISRNPSLLRNVMLYLHVNLFISFQLKALFPVEEVLGNIK